MDRELAKWIAEIASAANQRIATETPRFLASRSIERLFHFTSIRNLESIAKNGFMGRDSLKENQIQFETSDNSRIEPIIDGVCFSIEKPNKYMMSRKISNGQDIVLLELAPISEILSKFNFVAIPTNFGASTLKSLLQSWPERFVGGEGLMSLFLNEGLREKYSLESFEPTDPQSEIILLDPLPWAFVRKIYAPPQDGYASPSQVSTILHKLPTGTLFQSKNLDWFPEIDWKKNEIMAEFNERKWNESWM
jgi:hypothetical protein